MKILGIIENNITGPVYGEIEIDDKEIKSIQKTNDAEAAYAATKRIQKARYNKKVLEKHTQHK